MRLREITSLKALSRNGKKSTKKCSKKAGNLDRWTGVHRQYTSALYLKRNTEKEELMAA